MYFLAWFLVIFSFVKLHSILIEVLVTVDSSSRSFMLIRFLILEVDVVTTPLPVSVSVLPL